MAAFSSFGALFEVDKYCGTAAEDRRALVRPFCVQNLFRGREIMSFCSFFFTF